MIEFDLEYPICYKFRIAAFVFLPIRKTLIQQIVPYTVFARNSPPAFNMAATITPSPTTSPDLDAMLLATPFDHLGMLTCFDLSLRALANELQEIHSRKHDFFYFYNRNLARSYITNSVSHLGLLSSMGKINGRKISQFTYDEAIEMGKIMKSIWTTEEFLVDIVKEVKLDLGPYGEKGGGAKGAA